MKNLPISRRLGPTLAALTAFALAMAYLEASVVVYLRELNFPAGFAFPLPPLEPAVLAIEVGREAATLLMLAAVSHLAATAPLERAACFAFLFGVWDIAYYLWLKLFLGWPANLLTWDLLFLIPVAWIGPVLAPVLISVLLIVAALRFFALRERGVVVKPDRWSWAPGCVGGLIILYTFTEEVIGALARGGTREVQALVPETFDWPVYLIGLALMGAAFMRALRCRLPRTERS